MRPPCRYALPDPTADHHLSGLKKPKKEGSLLTQAAIRSELILTSDDLDLLSEFLNAWCAENSVHIESEAAREVATDRKSVV